MSALNYLGRNDSIDQAFMLSELQEQAFAFPYCAMSFATGTDFNGETAQLQGEVVDTHLGVLAAPGQQLAASLKVMSE